MINRIRLLIGKILLKLDFYKIIHLSDEKFLKITYEKIFCKKLNLDNPQTFNEKLQWLKLYNRKDIYTTMVDKYEVKKYVANIIGEEYIISTLGIYDKFEDIDFDNLPNQFVMKCTHDSGGLVICKNKDKLDYKNAKKKIEKSLKHNYFYNGREWPYKNVKPRIIIEKYMENKIFHELRDYKFFCFNGKVKFFKIDFDRFTNHRANYYDTQKNILNFGEKIYPPNFEKKIYLPETIDEMIKLAEKLAVNIPFVRIDFYDVNGKIYFGEITFFPASGFGKFDPESYDQLFGDWIKLPKKDKERK